MKSNFGVETKEELFARIQADGYAGDHELILRQDSMRKHDRMAQLQRKIEAELTRPETRVYESLYACSAPIRFEGGLVEFDNAADRITLAALWTSWDTLLAKRAAICEIHNSPTEIAWTLAAGTPEWNAYLNTMS